MVQAQQNPTHIWSTASSVFPLFHPPPSVASHSFHPRRGSSAFPSFHTLLGRTKILIVAVCLDSFRCLPPFGAWRAKE